MCCHSATAAAFSDIFVITEDVYCELGLVFNGTEVKHDLPWLPH